MPIVTTDYLDQELAVDLTATGGGGRSGTKKITIPGDAWGETNALGTDAAGRVYVGGTTQQGGALTIPFVGAEFRFAPWAWRLLANGDPDPSWNGGAPRILSIGAASTAAVQNETTDVYVYPDGHSLWSSVKNDPATGFGAFNLYKLLPDGSDDPAWGVGGQTNFNFHSPGGNTEKTRILPMKVGANAGKIIWAAGRSIGFPAASFYLRRFTAAGAIDGAFNAPSGFQQSELAPGSRTIFNSLWLDAADNIYIGGYTTTDAGFAAGWYIEKYTADGAPVVAWGGLGGSGCAVRVLFPNGGNNELLELMGLSDGTILGCGSSSYNVGGNVQVTFANWDHTTGTLVGGFGAAGLKLFDYHATLQPDTFVSRALLMAADDVFVGGGTSGNVAGQGFSDGGYNFNARYAGGNAALERWHNRLPNLGSSSEIEYEAWAPGYPGAVASSFYAGGHWMKDLLVPRRAQPTLSKFLADGTLDLTFGD